jgi:hypothetical protein
VTAALTLQRAQTIAAALTSAGSVHLYAAQELPVRIAEAGLAVLALGVPGAAQVLDALALRRRDVSRTIPTPWGPVITLSERASEDPVELVGTIAHELAHVAQIREVGAVQMGVDYLGSGELRSAREAQAAVCGAWARYLLTGVPPDPQAQPLDAGLYHLDRAELALAQGLWLSGTATIREGLCPPYEVAQGVLTTLRAFAPDAILAPEHRP